MCFFEVVTIQADTKVHAAEQRFTQSAPLSAPVVPEEDLCRIERRHAMLVSGDVLALSHPGVIIIWWMGVEKIMCEVKNI